jgi:hypothetical protein
MPSFYCVKCKKKVECSSTRRVGIQTKRGKRTMDKSKCPFCSTTVNKFVSGSAD